MKAFHKLLVVAAMFFGSMTSYGQVVEVPGDNFSLEGALELFKKSSSPEEFERMLNSADAKVNNLDLNGDGYVDYVRVLDRNEGNVHIFVLQALISEYESQDVATIELEKLANGKAVLQIIGDEDIYGVTTIIEPTKEVRTYAGTRTSPTVVNVWAWPTVQYVYGPRYTVWVSPWGWRARPIWWQSWRPVTYVHYHAVWRPYHPYYSVCHTRRVVHAHRIYHPYRSTSVIVYNRHHTQINHYRSTYRDDRNGRTRVDRSRHYANDNSSGRNNGSTSGRTRNDYDAPSRSDFRQERTSSTDGRYRAPERTSPSNENRSREWTGNNNTTTRTPSTTVPEKQRDITPRYDQRPTRRQEAVPAERQTSSEQRRTFEHRPQPAQAPQKTERETPRETKTRTINNTRSSSNNNSDFARRTQTPPSRETRNQVNTPPSVERRAASTPSRQQPAKSSGNNSSQETRRGR